MTVNRNITLHCNSDNCPNTFQSNPDIWVDGPVRSQAFLAGWKYVGHKDICPECVAAIQALNTCSIPGSNK